MEHNIEKDYKFVNKCNMSEETWRLKKCEYLYNVEKAEAWKKEEYYCGNIELKEKYIKEDFSFLIFDYFKADIVKYNRTTRIIKAEAQDFYLKYGLADAITLIESTKKEQGILIKDRETYFGAKRAFSVRKSDLWPKKYLKRLRKKEEKKREGYNDGFKEPTDIDDSYKNKYEALKIEFDKYKEWSEDQIGTLKKTIKILSINGEIIEKKSKSFIEK